jgi:hypothetical protein
MVTSNFFVMLLLSMLCFSLGRIVGKMESAVIMTNRLNSIMFALKKIEAVSSLKGENLATLSTEELVNRIQKQMELEDDNHG